MNSMVRSTTSHAYYGPPRPCDTDTHKASRSPTTTDKGHGHHGTRRLACRIESAAADRLCDPDTPGSEPQRNRRRGLSSPARPLRLPRSAKRRQRVDCCDIVRLITNAAATPQSHLAYPKSPHRRSGRRLLRHEGQRSLSLDGRRRRSRSEGVDRGREQAHAQRARHRASTRADAQRG